jgi:hypothetical protein
VELHHLSELSSTQSRVYFVTDPYPFPPPQESSVTGSGDPVWQKIVDAIKLLVSCLAPNDRERVLREIMEPIRPIPASPAGQVLGTIVSLLPRRPRWTVEDLKHQVTSEGIAATSKEVYKALGSLTRKRLVRRVGRYYSYCLLVVFIALAVTVGATALGGGINSLFTKVGNELGAVTPSVLPPTTPTR